jgi:hypothetical protein
MPSDSETYSASPAPSSSTPLVLYKPPTLWGLLRGAAINVLLPFINGLMLGFGELVANEWAFRLGWGGTKVRTSVSELEWSRGAYGGIRGIMERANKILRFSRIIAAIHDELGRGWRCGLILLSGGEGMGRSWICILRWSEEMGSAGDEERGGIGWAW